MDLLKVTLLFFLLTVASAACVTTTAQGCDARCTCCISGGITNYYCDSCNSGSYMWLSHENRCEKYCPPGEYISSTTTCGPCHGYCETCNGGSFTNCLSCKSDAFVFNDTTCYNLPDPTFNGSTYYNPCVAGTYAWPLTMVCLPCPTGCSTCSLGLEYMMPASYQSSKTMTSGCTDDPDCLFALKCYTCNSTLNYIWVQFNCMPINQCRQYTYYASSSSTFDPAQCMCLPNYYQTGVMKCSRCHISCLNCTFNDDSHCRFCPDGFNNQSLTAPSECTTNGTYLKIEDWSGHSNAELTTADTGSFSAVNPTFKTCGDRYLWGCNDNNCVRGTLNYVASAIGVDHYGIRLRFAAVFIDGWPSTGAIFVTAKNAAGVYQDAFSYNYISYGAIGQFLCNKNTLDVVQVVDGWFKHDLNNLDFVLASNGADVGDYYFGMRELIVYKMKCHASCATCSGPTEDDCLSCPNTGQIVFNGTCDYTAGDCSSTATTPGKCVCDTSAGYFYDTTSCSMSCTPASHFRDKASRACVEDCPAPLVFGDTSNTNRFCVITCPSPYYKDYATMTCLSSCYLTGTANNLNYFKYNGSDPACFRVCPSETVADELTGSCLPKCSTGYYAHNGYCNATCPSGFYAYNVTNLCVAVCPDGYFMNNKTGTSEGICEYACTTNLGIRHYGDNSTGSCTDTCPNGTFSDPSTNMCVKFCDLAAGYYNQLVRVSATVWNGTCVTTCSSNFLGTGISYSNPITGYCVNATDCPDNYYGDSYNGDNKCVTSCTGPTEFGVNSSQKCETACGPGGIADGYKYLTTKVCVKICPSDPPLFGDQDGYCVSDCTGAYFADEQANRTCRLNCTASPAATFGEAFVCKKKCTAPLWGDSFSSTRACTNNCTHTAPNKSFGYDGTRLCVLKCPDTWFGMISISGVPTCVQTCQLSQNLFGDNLTNECTTHCPADYYGDTTPGGLRHCVQHCPPTYFSINVSGLRTCNLGCASGYADNATRVCVLTYTGCAEGTYGNDASHTCELPGSLCPTFADPVTQSCVPSCPVSATYRYFGNPSTSMCVLICPNQTDATVTEGLFGDNSTGTCQESCTGTTLRDYQNNRRCVDEDNCSRTPVALFGDTANDICVTAPNCPGGTFGDNYTKKCQSDCQGPTLLYADPVSKFCVATCPNLYYAVNSSVDVGICNQTCVVPLWADNATGQCTSRCSANTYGANYSMTGYSEGICESRCRAGEFARDSDNLCVFDCEPGLWGDTFTRKCLTAPGQCPDGYYANNVSNLCVVPMDCQLVGSTQYVADNSTKQCVPGCPLTTPRNYADMDKQLCVALCPIAKFGDNTTLKCLDECKDYSTGNYRGEFADSQLRLCVEICSSSPTPTFGENDTYTCVEAFECPTGTWAEDTVYNRQCRPICPPPNTLGKGNVQKYSDNTTTKCVQTCPENYFGSTHSGVGTCVSLCQVNTLFADNFSKTCVPQCPSSEGTFGDQATRTCVNVCPLGFFAQVSNRYCVFPCEDGTWGQEITRVCLTDNTACPVVNKFKQYADNFSHMCVSTCPIGQNTWGQNSTWYCVPTCLTGFKYTVTRVCIDLCPASLTGTGLFSDQGMCYADCITSGYYRDPQNARSCQATCSITPSVSYADSTTMNCVKQCPSYPVMYYDYDGDWTCRSTCPGNYHIDPISQKCVSPCPTGSFVDTNTDTCVEKCPYDTTNIYYGDPTATEPLCVVASHCPATYYADFDTRMCTQTCSTGLYKNNGTTTCVKFCPDGLYGSSSGYCVAPNNCPTDQYANNMTKTCVTVCNGSFADVDNYVCVFVCPPGLYADPYTRKCATNCTNNATVKLYINTDNQSCIAHCDPGQYLNTLSNTCQTGCPSPYFADPSTQVCVSSCPISPPLYGDDNARACVQFCPTGATQYYTNNQTRMCVQVCDTSYFRDNITLSCTSECTDPYFANSVTGYCVLNCSTMFALDDTNDCVNNCPSPYYDDPTTYKCVVNCPVSPTHYKLVVGTSRTCTTACPSGKWADLSTLACVTLCPSSPPRYADNNTWSCVSVCPFQNTGTPYSLYALNSTRSCVNICPNGMFAENTTRTCVSVCPNGTDTYADDLLAVPACVALCSSGTFADPVSLTCMSVCPSSPKTYSYEDASTRICVASCPFPKLSDLSTSSCVDTCPSASYPYKDISTKSCVAACPASINTFGYLAIGTTSAGQCVFSCPPNFFADNTTRTCVEECPDGYFGQEQNRTCQLTCSLANSHFADSSSNMCVDVCPILPTFTYGDRQTRTCVSSCPSTDFTFADPTTHLCEATCAKTPITYYRDPTTQKCVTVCPDTPDIYFADSQSLNCVLICSEESLTYGYIPTRTCVPVCLGSLFANDQTRLCVSPTGCQTGYFADNSTWTCVAICPLSDTSFGDPTTQTCVQDCPSTHFRDSSTRMCVQICPQIPNLYADNSSRDCVQQCPGNSYADNVSRVCVSNCPISPVKTFADNSTNKCVTTCPTQPNYFAQNHTWTCIDICPTTPDMFADYSTRSCVLTCPNDTNNTFADTSTRTCVRRCPDLPTKTFNDNATQRCKTACTTGYADNISKFCVAICPNYYYGENFDYTCVSACPTKVPPIFAEDNSRMCVANCNASLHLYADSYSGRCVKVCPIADDTYADNSSQSCVKQCSSNPLTYADSSTRTCVTTCPTVPAMWAINSTRVCTPNCPSGSYADNVSRLCVAICTTTPQTFGDNSTWSCVTTCPTKPWTFADISTQTCVPDCPGNLDYYADNLTRRCETSCQDPNTFADPTTFTCVTHCPDSYYAEISSGRCKQGCQPGFFADVLLRKCVTKCSVDPVYYGNPLTHVCVPLCPIGSISFGNPQTQECVTFDSNGLSGCPSGYFSDNVTRLCVKVCPMKNYTFADNSTRRCVAVCPAGSINTFADNSTMRCVSTCPSMPDYYAENTTRTCVKMCLPPTLTFSGTFADNHTRTCRAVCPSDPDFYSDNSTLRCVSQCPVNPLTFADYSTRRCVTTCPDSPDIYGDLKSRRCVLTCPEDQQTYADPLSRRCVRVCPSPLFGENETNRCEANCPDGSYADNSTRLCVAVCPEYPITYGDSSSHKCVSLCPVGTYADQNSQTCVGLCPFTPNKTYGEQTTRQCLTQCPMNLFTYADDSTRRCVATCPQPQGTYGTDINKTCMSQCPDVPFLFAENITRRCRAICPSQTGGGFAENISRVCVAKCPDLTYGDSISLYCKFYCDVGFFALQGDNLCVANCPSPLFADNTTRRCVSVCPVEELLFGVSLTRTCNISCPVNTYADALSQQCVTNCPPSQDTYAYDGNNTCVKECPLPLYAYNVLYVCLATCPDPYYPNLTDHRCYKCPDECAICQYPQMCTKCITNYFLYSGTCVASCPLVPVVTYANINGTCGSSVQCSAGFFALNSTKSCVQTCPAGYYKNTVQQTCQYCMKGCTNCNNFSICLGCNSQTALWDNYTCYPYCSRLKRYYFGSGCTSTCPAGTFLNLTFCTDCDATCNTCALQPSNCLTCANGLYLRNHICVATCPNNSRPAFENSSLICKICGTSGLNCQTQNALTYTVNQTVENYKYKLYLTFSKPVTITGNIQNIIQIIQVTSRRRFMADVSTVNYTIIDYGNGVYGFLINGFDSSMGGNVKFQLQILNPTAIKAADGSIPQQTRMDVIVSETVFYDLTQYTGHFANYGSFITGFSILLLIGMIWGKAEVWIPMFDVLQMLFVLYFTNVVFPPNLGYLLASFQASFLNFIPNMFSGVIPKAIMNSKLTGQVFSLIGDFMFLRNEGYLLTITLILLLFVGTMLLLTKNKSIIKDNNKRLKLKKFWKDVILARYIYNISYILFLPTLFFAFFQMRDFTIYWPVVGFSIFCSLVYLIIMLAVVIWLAYKVIRFGKKYPVTLQALSKSYNVIKESPAKLMESEDNKFTLDNNQIDLRKLEQPKINGKLILPMQISTHFESAALAAPFINYIFKMMVSIFMVASFQNSTAQLLLLTALYICQLGYLIRVKPYIYKKGMSFIQNWLLLANCILFTCILIVMVAFVIKYTQLTQENRILMGDIACYLILFLITYNVCFFVYRSYEEWNYKLWRPFVYSECFKENFPIEHFTYIQEYEAQSKEEKRTLRKKKKKLVEEVALIEKEVKGLEVDMTGGLKEQPSHITELGIRKKDVTLRPTQKQIIKNDLQTFVNDVYEKEKSRSHKSSSSLSRKDRKKMIETIFAQKKIEKHDFADDYELVVPRAATASINKANDEIRLKEESQESDEYEYEEYEEEYPEDTDAKEILAGKYKGNVVIP